MASGPVLPFLLERTQMLVICYQQVASALRTQSDPWISRCSISQKAGQKCRVPGSSPDPAKQNLHFTRFLVISLHVRFQFEKHSPKLLHLFTFSFQRIL